jgi:hypothetical protein
VFHGLELAFKDKATVTAVLEERPSRWGLARRRARRLGWFTVAGHVVFVGLILPALNLFGRARARAIVLEHGLDLSPIDGAVLVPSVNTGESVDAVRQADPTLVVVHGTRIITERVLNQIGAPVVNLHAGITPRYRGVHGGYWAFFDERPDLAGTTIHFVDRGIDTGGILRQATFERRARDTIATYPFLHVACGLPPLVDIAQSVVAGQKPVVQSALAGSERSQLRWHPTAWGYIAARIRRGVR